MNRIRWSKENRSMICHEKHSMYRQQLPGEHELVKIAVDIEVLRKAIRRRGILKKSSPDIEATVDRLLSDIITALKAEERRINESFL